MASKAVADLVAGDIGQAVVIGRADEPEGIRGVLAGITHMPGNTDLVVEALGSTIHVSLPRDHRVEVIDI